MTSDRSPATQGAWVKAINTWRLGISNKAGKGIRTLDIQLGSRVSQAPLERKPRCGSLNTGAPYRLCRLFLRTSVQPERSGASGVAGDAEAECGDQVGSRDGVAVGRPHSVPGGAIGP